MGKVATPPIDAQTFDVEEQSKSLAPCKGPVDLPQQTFKKSRAERATKIIFHAIVIILCVLFIKAVLEEHLSGNVVPPRDNANGEIIVHTNSDAITEPYALYDLLSITSNSGSIDITVDPQPISMDEPKAAILRVSTNSGSVRVNTVMRAIPDRVCEWTVASRSGQLEVNSIHGKESTFRTENGQIKADVYPYGFNNTRSSIDARSSDGSIDLTLHSSLSHPAVPLKKLRSLYRTSSGSINVFYPAQWQGTVEGSTGSGSVTLYWDGLQIGMFLTVYLYKLSSSIVKCVMRAKLLCR